MLLLLLASVPFEWIFPCLAVEIDHHIHKFPHQPHCFEGVLFEIQGRAAAHRVTVAVSLLALLPQGHVYMYIESLKLIIEYYRSCALDPRHFELYPSVRSHDNSGGTHVNSLHSPSCSVLRYWASQAKSSSMFFSFLRSVLTCVLDALVACSSGTSGRRSG